MYDFIERFAPHLTKELVERASLLRNQEDVDKLFENIELPIK
jgi:LysR family cys regulon transcriptional activator